jgi:hypothetical protein
MFSGMPHIHGVAWIDKSALEKYLQPGHRTNYNENVIELIDKLITCKLPEDDEELLKKVTEVQKHGHSKSCRKYKNFCRFGFPRLPSDETIIASPLPSNLPDDEAKQITEKATEILMKAHMFLEGTDMTEEEKDCLTLEQFLAIIAVTKQDYKDALKISNRGRVIVLKQSVKERNINNYNPEFLKAWDANMDIQA